MYLSADKCRKLICVYILHEIISIRSKCVAFLGLVLFTQSCSFTFNTAESSSRLALETVIELQATLFLFRPLGGWERGNFTVWCFLLGYYMNADLYYRPIGSRKGCIWGRDESQRPSRPVVSRGITIMLGEVWGEIRWLFPTSPASRRVSVWSSILHCQHDPSVAQQRR